MSHINFAMQFVEEHCSVVQRLRQGVPEFAAWGSILRPGVLYYV